MLKLASTLIAIAACSGTSTGSACPSSNAPTYVSFGQRFFTSYCATCHARRARDRHGAPPDETFDTEQEIRAHATEIDQVAAKGPNATNEDMPDTDGPVRSLPSDTERELLGQFLACETRRDRSQ